MKQYTKQRTKNNGTNINSNNLDAELQFKLRQALISHQNGNFHLAENMYRQILDKNPEHADSNHLLGLLMHQIGKIHAAKDFISKAISSNPYQSLYFNNLGIILGKQGNNKEALAAFNRALEINPKYEEAYLNLGIVYQNIGEIDNALSAFNKALKIRPDLQKARMNHGIILKENGNYNEALTDFNNIIAMHPNNSQAHFYRGVILLEYGKLNEALSSFEHALQIRPEYAEANNNRGIVLQKMGRLDEALAAFDRALQIKPDYAEALNNRGYLLKETGNVDDALVNYDKAIQIKPDYVDAHWNRSFALLLKGNLEEGFREFEWRWQKKDSDLQKRNYHQPLWDGSPLNKKKLFLYAEQGTGDSIQFIRYVHRIPKKDGQIIVECEKSLVSLFSHIPEIDVLICRDDDIPDFHFHAPLMSLPYLLNTTLDTIPCSIPYLFPPSSSFEINKNSDSKNIGIVWAGNPKHKNDQNRSIDILYFTDLFDLKNTKFFSLQVGKRSKDIEHIERNHNIEDLSRFLNDYSVTASVIHQLDLVISVDTSVAHLAGALGKPIWILLPFSPDWRWMLNRENTPWYPTMRLFRQPKIGDWNSVINKIKSELGSYGK